MLGDGKRVKNRGEGLFALGYGAVFLGLLERNPQVEASLCLACICALNQSDSKDGAEAAHKPEGTQRKCFPGGVGLFPSAISTGRQTVLDSWTVTQGTGVWLQAVLTSSLTLNKPRLVFKPPCPYLPNGLAGLCELLGHIELQ